MIDQSERNPLENDASELTRLEKLLRALADEADDGQVVVIAWDGRDRSDETYTVWSASARLVRENRTVPHGEVVVELQRQFGQRPAAGEALPLLVEAAETKARERAQALTAAVTQRSGT